MNNLPTVDELIERYKAACMFNRPVDKQKIEHNILEWWKQISDIDITVKFVTSKNEIRVASSASSASSAARDARIASGAGAARTARPARATRAAGAAWDARTASGAGAARTARAAWDARTAWDASYWCITAIGALSRDDINTFSAWRPLFDAFEAGLWTFFICEDRIICLTLPSVFTDDENRLHRFDGPAFEYGDIEQYYVHGVLVPGDLINDPNTITAQRIDNEQNAEVRRVMIDMFTAERYILESGAINVSCDNFGTLWLKHLDDDEDIYMVEVINSTPEPDGHNKHYWLRVDPRAYHGDAARYAQAAVASTWRDQNGNMIFDDWRNYAPIFES